MVMVKQDTNQSIKNRMIIKGVQLAGTAAGVHLSKYKTKKTIEKNLSLVNSLIRVGLSNKNAPQSRLKKNIELAGLGGIALYNFYRGVKRKQTALVIQGAFLSIALLSVIFKSSKVEKENS